MDVKSLIRTGAFSYFAATALDGFTLVSSTETRASSEDDIFHNTNILRWAPFQNKLGIGWDYQTLLEKSPLKLNVIGDYVNQEATSSRLIVKQFILVEIRETPLQLTILQKMLEYLRVLSRDIHT